MPTFTDSLGHAKGVLRSILWGYAQIYFGKRYISGLLFLAATFVVPWHGLSGLVALLLTNVWALVLGRPHKHIEEGYYAFNGLLVGLALGLFFRFSPAFALVLVLASLLTVLFAAGLRNLSERYLGLPVLSLAFVFVTWIALLATRRFAGVEFTVDTVLVAGLGAGWLPEWFELYLRSLGAAFFQLSVLSGMLVMAGLLIFSRWAWILSVIGFASGWAVYRVLGGVASDLSSEYIGFNFILTAIAVGGIWLVLRPASMLLAAVAAALAALLSAAAMSLFKPLGLPILAMPFIMAVQLILFAMLIRPKAGRLQMVSGDPDSPERNLSRSTYMARRYPDPRMPVFYLPVMGRWLVSQGPEGTTTHQGLWSHAWDFEVDDEEGRRFRGEGEKVDDYFAWGKPVMAPAEGRVMRVVKHLADNPVGEVDTQNNWGNLVILWHGADVFSALCHLAKDSVTVAEGETVTKGQILAKVGNSGRSPIPHLHMQIQASAEVGAQTRQAEFIHYRSFTEADSDGVYVTHGSPTTDSLVEGVDVDEVVRAAVTLAPGLSWRWQIEQGERRGEERWQSKIDSLGTRLLQDEEGRARLRFFADDHYTTLLDYEGSKTRLLALFYLGMPRLPYLKDRDLGWDDQPSPEVFLSAAGRLLHELALPFFELNRLTTSSHLMPGRMPASVRLVTRLQLEGAPWASRRLPDRIEIEFEPGSGPVAIDGFLGDEQILKARVSA
ncbi:MAG: urea transporter [Deltaproteobacteria bacterium]|nr:urea transporter [Deltaproteobacteria bacterium]